MGDFFVSLENKTKMKRFLFALVPAFVALSITGCKEDEVTAPPIAEPVDLTMTVNSTSLVMGETLEITLATTNPDETANEDFTIDLTAMDGAKDQSSVLFENFPSTVDFAKGESSAKVTVDVKKEGITGSNNVTIKATSRGYTIAPDAGINLVIGDYHYVTMSIENNTDNTVNEGASFVLVADFGREATEDIVITVTPKEGEESNYEGLPETLTIKKGETSVKSEPVTMVKDQGKEDRTLTLTFASSVEANPVSNPTMQIKRVDMDKDLGDPLTDERWVYPAGADVAFVSEKNQDAVKSWNPSLSTLLVKSEETPHPGIEGWTFYNALEFHNIAGVRNAANQYGNYVPVGLAMQNTNLNQDDQAVDNERYTTVTSDGYVRLWSVKETWNCTGPAAGQTRSYGVGGFHCCKFDHADPLQSVIWPQRHTRILPGMRIEARIRLRGALNRHNPAFWLQGNESQNWPLRGEVDILESPYFNAETQQAWQTLHLGESQEEDPKPTTNGINLSTISDWNIYWFEWSDDGKTLKCGINGETKLTYSADQSPVDWPYDDKTINPQGLYMLITLDAPNSWAGGAYEGWDSGFANISWEESKTNVNTPRMEIDWIRFYISAGYNDPFKAQRYTDCLY